MANAMLPDSRKIIFLILLPAVSCFAQIPDRILVGTVYNIFHEEYKTDQEFYEQVDIDIPKIKSCNIDHILIFPMSQWDPAIRQLLWRRTDYLIKKIEDSGLKFVPLMLKEEQCSHYFPIWKFEEIPGLWKEYELRNKNDNNRENVDFADPRIFPLVEDYFKSVIERYGKSPALSFYNIWNEPHYNSDADHVVTKFREWLNNKYGTLDKLSRSWGEDYTDWRQATPFLNDNWNSSMPQIDWMLFKNEFDGVLLDKLIRTLRKYDTIHPVNANPVGTSWSSFHDPGGYNTDNWIIGDHNDLNGISYYPDGWEREHNLEPCPYWLHNLTFNTIRCSSGNKNYILTELYTNTQNGLALNGYLKREDVNLLAWTALSNDCKGMIYWKWDPFKRGRQSLGRGLCGANGELAPRGEAVRDFGAVIKRYGEILYNARLKKPETAIMVDMTGLLKMLEQTAEPLTRQFMFESNAGLFKALYEANITSDLLRMDRNIDGETLKSYKIIFLPFQIVMRREIADKLKEYVRGGGFVVADARTATIDELDFAYKISPGAGLDQLFGADRTDWSACKEDSKIIMKNSDGNNSYEFEGKYFRDQLHISGKVKILGRFSDSNYPAIIENQFGKGTAILSAVPLGASYYDRPGNPAKRLIISLAEKAGVLPSAKFISDGNESLDIKVHSSGGKMVVYALNPGDSSKKGIIRINLENQKAGNVRDIILNRDLHFEQHGSYLSVPVEINKNDVMVLLLEM